MSRRDIWLLNGLAFLVLAGALAAVLVFDVLGGGRDERAQPPQPTTQPAPTTTSLPALTTTQPTRQPIIRYSLETEPTVRVRSAIPGRPAGWRYGRPS